MIFVVFPWVALVSLCTAAILLVPVPVYSIVPRQAVVMGSCQMTCGPAKSFAYSDAHCSVFTSNSQTALISEWYLVSVMTDPEWAESSHNPRKCEKAVAKESQVQTLNGYFGKKAHEEGKILSQLLLLDQRTVVPHLSSLLSQFVSKSSQMY